MAEADWMADELNPAKRRTRLPAGPAGGPASAEEVLELPKPKHIRALKYRGSMPPDLMNSLSVSACLSSLSSGPGQRTKWSATDPAPETPQEASGRFLHTETDRKRWGGMG
jgi:hypothetical protein